MDKKGYKLVADAIADSLCNVDGRHIEFEHGVRLQYLVLIHKIADAMTHDNAAFDRDKFTAACGVEYDCPPLGECNTELPTHLDTLSALKECFKPERIR